MPWLIVFPKIWTAGIISFPLFQPNQVPDRCLGGKINTFYRHGATVCKLRLLGGITAAGKTEWAIAWAKKNKGEILSCDSVSCYRGWNIGSAKPGPDETKQVKHHGIDLIGLDEVFDVVAIMNTHLES